MMRCVWRVWSPSGEVIWEISKEDTSMGTMHSNVLKASVFLCALCAGGTGDASAGEGLRRSGPLAALPSAPGAHIKKIKALGANQWLYLGAPAADPKWGRALGCSWGGKSMVLAPELRGAFRTGEGRHAYVKPDGFGQDDYWFYDINAHRWICLYPGTDTRNFNKSVKDGVLKVDDVGRVVDPSGQPVPGHLLIHAFGYLGYDTDLKKFTIVTVDSTVRNGFRRYYMPGVNSIAEGLTLLEEQGLNKAGPNFAPWAYNTQTGKFERDLATNAMPGVGGYFPQLLYIPSKKELFVGGTIGIAFFNPTTRTWSALVPNTGGPKGWSLACYDSKRDRVYGGHEDLYCYDVKTRTLTRIKKSAAYSLHYSNNRSALVYDSVSDKVLCLAFRAYGGGEQYHSGIVAPLDPETNTWGEAIPFDPQFKTGQTNAAFYDPELGVVFVYSAGDSADNGVMWVYRFKGGGGAVKD
jgi:hypothetical protein